MFRTIQDFKEAFQYESESTRQVLKNISNETLNLKPHDNIRSMQRLVWHITITLGEMLGKAGLIIDCPDEHSEPLQDIYKICSVYETAAKSVIEQVEKNWSDADLTDEVEMYGEIWKKGIILNILIKHEIHHRGQLTTLMRLNDLIVPGVYGPSKEEWATWNMKAPD